MRSWKEWKEELDTGARCENAVAVIVKGSLENFAERLRSNAQNAE